MEALRGPYEGVRNILRFNWHFYVLAAGIVSLMLTVAGIVDGPLRLASIAVAGGAALTTTVSIVAAWYIYDASGLYAFHFLPTPAAEGVLVNIHAGFDESSAEIARCFPGRTLVVLDFYDPARHTEVSIKRARRWRPSFAGTIGGVNTGALPLANASAAAIYVIFAAHEIRDAGERSEFFRELRRILRPDGVILLVEHFRDLPNALVWTAGVFHFLPESAFREAIASAGLHVRKASTHTSFVYVWEIGAKPGNAS